MGTAVAGEVFTGATTAHDLTLRTDNTNRIRILKTTGNTQISGSTEIANAGASVFKVRQLAGGAPGAGFVTFVNENASSATSSAFAIKSFVLGSILSSIVGSAKVVKRPSSQVMLPQETCTYNVEVFLDRTTFAKIEVEVDIASEFRYRDHPFRSDNLMIFISQSGETADSIASLKFAKQNHQKTLAVVNVEQCNMASIADAALIASIQQEWEDILNEGTAAPDLAHDAGEPGLLEEISDTKSDTTVNICN
jgi:hypothetical protein